METEEAEQERSRTALRELVSGLAVRSEAGQVGAAEMILSCRRILDLWLRLGGSSTDDPVIGFLGIESQTDHVLRGRSMRSGRDADHVRFRSDSPEDVAEVEDCGRWFLDGFKRDVLELGAHLNVR